MLRLLLEFVCCSVDGGYCEWSPWQRCDDVTGDCLCRMRLCECPEPRSGGRQCEAGSTQLQVVNCTGRWTHVLLARALQA